MTAKNEDPKPTDNTEASKQETSACGPDCNCHAAGPACRVRWIAVIIIILAAGVLVTRAMMKNNCAPDDTTTASFAALPAAAQPPAPVANATSATPAMRQADGPSGRLSGGAAADNATTVPATIAVKELGALSDLNTMAADTSAVFVFLPGKNDPPIKAPLAQMRSAAKTIEAQGQTIGLFTLKTDSPDYAQVAAQASVPCVLAMVKGRGMVPIAGDITETKLIQGFVAASSAGGCGPSSGGCGPSGCN